jgi:hypothetical protein
VEQEPTVDVLVIQQKDGEAPTPQVDQGVSPDSAPVNTCTPGRLLWDDFESMNYSKSQWSVDKISGSGEVFLSGEGDGRFKPVPIPDTAKYLQFSPGPACCNEACKHANQLALVSRPLEMGDCNQIKIGLYFITDGMEMENDDLSVEYRTADGNWRSVVSLFPEVNRTPLVWTYWQGEIEGIKSRQVQIRVHHTSQCTDDFAAIDLVRISRN